MGSNLWADAYLVRAAEKCDEVPLGRRDEEWIWSVIHEIPTTRWQDLGDYVREGAQLADFRQTTAKHHFEQLARTMIDQDHFEIVVRPKQQTRPRTIHMPAHLHSRSLQRVG